MERPNPSPLDRYNRDMAESYRPTTPEVAIRRYLDEPLAGSRPEGVALEVGGQFTRLLRADGLRQRAETYCRRDGRQPSDGQIAAHLGGVIVPGLTEGIRLVQTQIVSPVAEVLGGAAWEPYYAEALDQPENSPVFGPLQVVADPAAEATLSAYIINGQRRIGPEDTLLSRTDEFISTRHGVPIFEHNKSFQDANNRRKREIDGFWRRRPQLKSLCRTLRRDDILPPDDLYAQGVIEVMTKLFALQESEVQVVATSDELRWQPWVHAVRHMFEAESWRHDGQPVTNPDANRILTLIDPEEGVFARYHKQPVSHIIQANAA